MSDVKPDKQRRLTPIEERNRSTEYKFSTAAALILKAMRLGCGCFVVCFGMLCLLIFLIVWIVSDEGSLSKFLLNFGWYNCVFVVPILALLLILLAYVLGFGKDYAIDAKEIISKAVTPPDQPPQPSNDLSEESHE